MSSLPADHPKTAKSTRTVAIPTFTADAFRHRLANPGMESLLFQSRGRHTADDGDRASLAPAGARGNRQ